VPFRVEQKRRDGFIMAKLIFSVQCYVPSNTKNFILKLVFDSFLRYFLLDFVS